MVCGFFGVQFVGKPGPQASSCHVDLFTQLSSNNFCSTVTHIVHHMTCSPSLLVAVAVLMLQ